MSEVHDFLEGLSCLRETDGPVVCDFTPCHFFFHHLPRKDSVFLGLAHAYMASAVYSLS